VSGTVQDEFEVGMTGEDLIATLNNEMETTAHVNDDGAIEALLSVRAGTATELDAIVLKLNELAVERSSGGVAQGLRVGDNTTSGGTLIVGNTVIQKRFSPAVTSTSESALTDIPGTNFTVNTPLPPFALVSFSAHLTVTGPVGCLFQWNQFRNLFVTIATVSQGGWTWQGQLIDATIPTSQTGFFIMTGSGITNINAATSARIRCLAAPGVDESCSLNRIYCQYRMISDVTAESP
jgi:hypothetical protein